MSSCELCSADVTQVPDGGAAKSLPPVLRDHTSNVSTVCRCLVCRTCLVEPALLIAYCDLTCTSPEVAASILRKCKWNIRQVGSLSRGVFMPLRASSGHRAPNCNSLLRAHLALGQAKSAVRWTNGEFVQGLARLGVDSIVKIRDSLKSMRAELTSPSKFKDFYAYAFDISRWDRVDSSCNVTRGWQTRRAESS
eukprot:758190-Hanusia_phi.AAC.3